MASKKEERAAKRAAQRAEDARLRAIAGQAVQRPRGNQTANVDPAFWARFRSVVQRIENHAETLAFRSAAPPSLGARLRAGLEIVGGGVALTGLVLAIIGLNQNTIAIEQNATQIEALSDSLQREEIAAVFGFGSAVCGDPDTDTIQSQIGEVYLTNVGRLPVTVVHVGDGSDFVNEFRYVRLDEQPFVSNSGPFYLDVGQAVAVSFASLNSETFISSVTLRLSNGKDVVTTNIGGNGRWLLATDFGNALQTTELACPVGIAMGYPLSEMIDSTPDEIDYVPATPEPTDG